MLKGEEEVRQMKKNESFGEQALYFDQGRSMTIRAATEVKCLALGREQISKVLGDKVQAIAFRNVQQWAIEKCDVLKNLTKMQIEKLLEKFQLLKLKKGKKKIY